MASMRTRSGNLALMAARAGIVLCLSLTLTVLAAGFRPAGNLITARQYHTATLLPDGRVLVVGGFGGDGGLTSAELYDPIRGIWTNTGSLNSAHYFHTSTLLRN